MLLNATFPKRRKRKQLQETGPARSSAVTLARLSFAIGVALSGSAMAQGTSTSGGAFDGPQSASARVDAHLALRERDALFEPAGWSRFYENLDRIRDDFYNDTGLKLSFFHSTLYQAASDSLPGQDSTGLTTIYGLYGTWDIFERGNPSAGQLGFGIEARTGYGDRLTASQLGNAGIGSATGTADPYNKTDPVLLLREIYLRGGSPETGWSYRIGKITPDRMLATSDHLNPISLFLPAGSEGAPTIAFPDSGLGIAAEFYPSDRVRLGFVVADANGDRTTSGDIGEGNFFKAAELQAKLFPITDKAGFSTFSIWQTDGTNDPDNALDTSTGESGWGYFVKLEQELSRSGKDIGMIRYGRAHDDAAVYEEMGSIRYVRMDPPDPFGLSDDVFGIAASFVEPVSNPFDRDEWGFDAFYRFNPLERVEATIGYQIINNPAYNPDKDQINVVSFRLTQFF